MSKNKNRLIYLITILGLIAITIISCYFVVVYNSNGRTFDNIDNIADYEYALLLGTSPVTPKGAHNYYFDNRIKSTVELYEAGKIKKVIASGGNYWYNADGNPKHKGCNELRSMQDSLIKYGVPVDAIILDYDGTRTLNSIIKVKEVYKIDSCIIVSQKYHNERAIFLADHYGLKAIGYNASPSHIRRNRIKNQIREIFARVKLFIDLALDLKPSFNTYSVKMPNGCLQDWYNEPDSIPGLTGAIAHRSNVESSWGLNKYFSTINDKPFYYNSRHGYYVLLPTGMGYNQFGESMMGSHSNEFYNADSTLVISCEALFYDILIDEIPNYIDSLRSQERQYLNELGQDVCTTMSNDVIVSKGRINHSIPLNPPADCFFRKWLLKKDISDRECEMSVTIFFNDSLTYRLKDLENIINLFPNLPSFSE